MIEKLRRDLLGGFKRRRAVRDALTAMAKELKLTPKTKPLLFPVQFGGAAGGGKTDATKRAMEHYAKTGEPPVGPLRHYPTVPVPGLNPGPRP